MLAWVRNQGCQALDERERVEDEVCCTVPPRTTQLVDDLAIGRQGEALGRDGRAGYIATEMLEALPVMGVNVDAGVEREAVLRGAQGPGLEGRSVGWWGPVAIDRATSVRAQGYAALDRCGGDKGSSESGSGGMSSWPGRGKKPRRRRSRLMRRRSVCTMCATSSSSSSGAGWKTGRAQGEAAV
ncbi:MAG: hypothetical protein ACI8Y8_001934 [Planctomycetota bacterium]|jgi:hypothetical protein